MGTVGSVNIGSEMDGKGVAFARPVLVLHVVGSKLALVVPTSTKEVNGRFGYLSFEIGKTKSLCLLQLRIISQKRIGGRSHTVSERRLKTVKNELRKLYELI